MTAQLDVPTLGAAYALKCRECGTTTDLGAHYACLECFGPLEVVYDCDAIRSRVSPSRQSSTSR